VTLLRIVLIIYMIFVSVDSLAQGLYLLHIAFIFYSVGAIGNTLVVYKNGGKMPVFDKDGKYSKKLEKSKTHCLLTKETKMPYLADIYELWGGMASIGDILIYIGLVIFMIDFFFGRL